MSWIGKTIGGTSGLTLGGPLGDICGRAIKEFYAKSVIPKPKLKALEEKYYGKKLTEAERSFLLFFMALCALLGKIVKAEGKVSREEVDASLNVLLGPLKLSGSTLAFAKIVFNESKNGKKFSAKAIAEQFMEEFSQQDDTVPEFFAETLIDIAFADGELHPAEWRMILSVGKALGLDKDRLRHAALKHTSEGDKNYAVLELEPDASDGQVRENGRKLGKVYNPNTLKRRRIPEELKKYSTGQHKAVTTSSQRILKKK